MMFASSVVGCSHLSQTNVKNEQSKSAVITDYQINQDSIAFSTIGYGCTFYNDFKIVNTKNVKNELEIIRLRSDTCSMKPRNVTLMYSIRHLELDLDREINLRNSISKYITNTIVSR